MGDRHIRPWARWLWRRARSLAHSPRHWWEVWSGVAAVLWGALGGPLIWSLLLAAAGATQLAGLLVGPGALREAGVAALTGAWTIGAVAAVLLSPWPVAALLVVLAAAQAGTWWRLERWRMERGRR